MKKDTTPVVVSKKSLTPAQKLKRERNMAAAADRLAKLQALQKKANAARKMGFWGSDTSVIQQMEDAQKRAFIEKNIKFYGHPLVRFLAGRQFHQPLDKVVSHIQRFIDRQREAA